LRNIRIHGLKAETSPPDQLICTLRNTRSGWGISAVKRPSAVVETAVGGGHRGQALGAAVRIGGIGLGGAALRVDETHRAQHALWVAALREIRITLAMRDRDRDPAAGHAGEEQARALQHLHQRQPRLELLAAVAGELRPGLGAGDERAERGHHLAAVAHAEREGVGAAEEGGEGFGQLRVEQDRARPALAGAERVAIAETAAGDEALVLIQPGATRLQVGHVDVEGVEAGRVERVAHLDLRVDALLAQDRHLRPRSVHERGGHVLGRVEAQVQRQQRLRVSHGRVLGVGAGRVVARARDLPADLVPGREQLGQRRAELQPGIAPDLDHAAVMGLADHVAAQVNARHPQVS